MEMDKELIADIQEITANCIESGVYYRLFVDDGRCREDIMELFAKWGEEFHETHKNFHWDGSVSYYDEIDAFVKRKMAELNNPYIDQYGNPYDAEGGDSWPAGGGLHKDCDYNAEALFAYYTLKSKSEIHKFLTKRGFKYTSVYGDDTWEKGNTQISFSSYDFGAEQYGYLHTERI